MPREENRIATTMTDRDVGGADDVPMMIASRDEFSAFQNGRFSRVSTMKTGFAIVGCGMISRFHAKAIADIEGAEIVGCFDSFGTAAEKYAEEIGCTAYDKLDDLLANPDVDIVTVCTPSGAHQEPAVAAANAGKHVVVEKPLEVTLARCDNIINACRANNVKLCTILPSRFSPANIAMKHAIDSGRFGKLTLGDSFIKWWRSQEYYDSGGWRGTFALDGGGAYMNQGIHNVDLLYWFMGDVAQVAAFTATLAHERIEVEDTGVATLRFANGALGVLEATTSAYPGLLKRTEIHGTTGSAIVEQDTIKLWDFAEESAEDETVRSQLMSEDTNTGGASDPTAIDYSGHREQLKDFINAIADGTEPVVNGEEGRKSVELILAIYKSSWTETIVKLPLDSDPTPPV
jgi:predicted dehydrogenase